VSFASDVHRIAKDMKQDVERVAAATFIELFTSVIKDTPADTGRLQGNWQTTTNTPATGLLTATGPAGAISMVALTISKPDLYYLTNNLPYAETIEFDGHSKVKAPRGMVRINVKRLEQILRKKARGLN